MDKAGAKGLYYIVDGWNNFCRVFRLPTSYPKGFCFVPKPVTFLMVDWFKPVPDLPDPAISKDAWIAKFGDYERAVIYYDELCNLVIPFIKRKNYFQGFDHLVVCSFGATLFVPGDV